MKLFGIEISLDLGTLNRLADHIERECPDVYEHIKQRGAMEVKKRICESQDEHPGYTDDGYCNGCGNHYEYCDCYPEY